MREGNLKKHYCFLVAMLALVKKIFLGQKIHSSDPVDIKQIISVSEPSF